MKILKSVSLAILAVLLIVIPVLAWSYSATITMIESGGNSYDGQSFSLDLDNAYMVHTGYSTTYGLDVQTTRANVNMPSMMVSDRTNFATDISASQTDTFTMTFGNTPTTSMPIVLGYGGYMTTSDTSALEPSDDFISEIDGYFDTSTTASSLWYATQRPLINKDLAIQTIIPQLGRVQTDIINGASTTVGNYNTGYSSDGALGLSGVYRSGNRFNSFPAGIISQVKGYLDKEGSPTGTIYMNVRKVSDDTLLGTLGTLDIATIDSSGSLYTFNTNRVSVGESQDIRIMAEAYFTSSSGSDYVRWGFSGTSATLTAYDGSYTDTSSNYVVQATYYPLYASVSGAVATGEHTVKTSSDPIEINENYNTGDDGEGLSLYGTNRMFQSFTPTASGIINSLKLLLYRNGTPGTLTVGIYATSAGKPTGTSLWTGTTSGNTLPTGSPYEWRTITSTDDLTINVGTQYAIVAYATAAFPNYVNWRTNKAAGYASGSYGWSGNNGTTWNIDTGMDAMFEVWVGDDLLKLYVDDVMVDSEAIVSVTGNANNWVFYPYSYWNYYKYSVNGVQVLQYAPERIVGNSTYSTGTSDVINSSASVVGQGTTFTYSMIGSLIKFGSDTVYYQIIGFTDATHITLDRVYVGSTAFGSTYTIVPRIQDEINYTYVSTPTWGSNPADFDLTISSLASYSTPGSVVTSTVPPDDLITVDLDSGALVRSDTEVNTLVNTNIFTPYWQPFSTITNIPVLVFLMAIATAFMVIAVVWVMRHTNNQLVGSFVLVVLEAIFWKAGIYELWMLIVTVFVCGAIIVFERKPSL